MPHPFPPPTKSRLASFNELVDLLSAEHDKVSTENDRLKIELKELRATKQGESTLGQQGLSLPDSPRAARNLQRVSPVRSDEASAGAGGVVAIAHRRSRRSTDEGGMVGAPTTLWQDIAPWRAGALT
mmetsp:Transcript_93157/g.299883  ORF Transcript_93157/g.299883 Transcript_93157/m.299883 type:complete len:127 (+) Transcript_93157:71-451(+)